MKAPSPLSDPISHATEVRCQIANISIFFTVNHNLISFFKYFYINLSTKWESRFRNHSEEGWSKSQDACVNTVQLDLNTDIDKLVKPGTDEWSPGLSHA